MPFAFACRCGKKYKTTTEHVGKNMKCRACGADIEIREPDKPDVPPWLEPIDDPALPATAAPSVASARAAADSAQQAAGVSGIEVSKSFFPIAILLLFCTPKVVINGTVYRRHWGTHFFELPPGTYTVRVYFMYFFIPECGDCSIDVTIAP